MNSKIDWDALGKQHAETWVRVQAAMDKWEAAVRRNSQDLQDVATKLKAVVAKL
jgi:hypothetical protein